MSDQFSSILPSNKRHTNSAFDKAKDNVALGKLFFTSGDEIFKFNDNVEIHLDKARSKEFYKLLNNKTHTGNHSGPTKWSKRLSLNEDA